MTLDEIDAVFMRLAVHVNTEAEALDARIVALIARFGADEYNHATHPLLRAVQDNRPRCIRACTCGGCRVWRGLALTIVGYLESLP